MFVIEVRPLVRGTKLESLSYFSAVEYPIGSFLTVPIRGKEKPAVVTAVRPVSSTKTALKAATFSLRKLPNQTNPVVLPETIRTTVTQLTKEYPASPGAILHQLLPPDIRRGTVSYPDTGTITPQQEETTPQLLTARVDERYDIYQSCIRSTFAHQGSILFVVPTSTDVQTAAARLSAGIQDRVVTFAPTQRTRARAAAYTAFADMSTTKLIITTPSFAYLERPDLLAVIIEQSASTHYVARQRPYLDHRLALQHLAAVAGRSLLLGDTVPRADDEHARREERFLTYGESAKRLAFAAPLTVIRQDNRPQQERPFSLFSEALLTTVSRTLEGKGRVFFYAARRGLAPVVACQDCGYIFRCPDSHTPYSLLRTYAADGTEARWFVSSTSGRRVRAADTCAQCGSWRLRERGIGIQTVADEWQERFPEIPPLLLDSSTARTPAQAAKLVNEFYQDRRSGLLIGTQLALPFLTRGVDVSAVISLDAARSIPSWRADEHLFSLLLQLRECSAREVLIQTRTTPDSLIEHAQRGAVERFYDEELALRAQLQYPPFAIFILLTWVGDPASVAQTESQIQEIVTAAPVHYYASPHSDGARIGRHGLIRLAQHDRAQYDALLDELRRLPPHIKIQRDPDRIV